MSRKVIGPTGSRRRRWLFLCTTVAALAAAAFFIAGAGAVTGSPSNFESQDAAVPNSDPPLPDANLTNDVSGNSDWNCFANGGATDTTGFVKSGITVGSTCSSSLVKANAVAKPDLAATTSDDSWKNGQKMDSPCAQLANNKNQPKDDFTAVASYNETASNKHTFLYGATIRVAPNGNASENLELNQVAGTAACPITRTFGDHLLAFDYLNGGTKLNLHVLTWIDNSQPGTSDKAGGNNGTCIIKTDSMPCWGANIITPAAAAFDGGVSQSAITAAKNGINGVALDANEFAEFGVDLTTALDQNPNACNTTSQITWESRASGSSFSSNPADISVENKTVTNCGEVIIKKHTDPRGVNKSFSYSSDMSGSEISCSLASPNTATSFSLNDNGNTTGDSAANTQDCTSVPAGTVHVTETVPNGWTLSSLTCSTGGSQDASDPTKADITIPAGGSVTCTYTNHQNTSSLSTQASNTGSVTPGAGVSDTATVTGDSVNGNTPSGTVAFYLCGPLASASGCTSSGTHLTADPSLSGSGITATATSPTVNSATPLTPGIYCFAAYWGGDNNYPAANSTTATNECFTVSKINTSTVTTPNDGSGTAETTITLGQTIYDTAVVTGNSVGGDPTGFVVFHECGPISTGNCSTGGNLLGSATGVALVSDGVANTYTSSATSDGFTPTAVGRYCFRGDYLGSTVYNPSSDPPNTTATNECFTVTDSTGSTSAQTWLPNDSGTVTAVHGAPLSGTLSIQLYTGDNCGVTSGSAVSGQLYTKTLTNATTAADRTLVTNNSSFTVSSSTSVSWLVTFSSTNANVAGSNHCEKTSLTITN
jgi:hypothetical protein